MSLWITSIPLSVSWIGKRETEFQLLLLLLQPMIWVHRWKNILQEKIIHHFCSYKKKKKRWKPTGPMIWKRSSSPETLRFYIWKRWCSFSWEQLVEDCWQGLGKSSWYLQWGVVWPHASSQEGNVGTGLVNKWTEVEIEGRVWSHWETQRVTFGSRITRNQDPSWPWPSPPFQVPSPPLPCEQLVVSGPCRALSLPFLYPLPGMPLPPLPTVGQSVFPPEVTRTSAPLWRISKPL